MNGGFDSFSMRDLFRVEARTQAEALVSSLLALENSPTNFEHLEACMRAAHSLKGAGRLVDVGAAVIIAHAMEELFVAAQEGRLTLNREQIDILLKGVDLISMIGDTPPPFEDSDEAMEQLAEDYVTALEQALAGQAVTAPIPTAPPIAAPSHIEHQIPEPLDPEPHISQPAPAPAPIPPVTSPPVATASGVEPPRATIGTERAMRVSADNLNRLLDLAGETLVQSRRLPAFTDSLHRLKHLQKEATRAVDALRSSISSGSAGTDVEAALARSESAVIACQQYLAEKLAELDAVGHQSTNLAHRLYDQALMVRMRPFADGIAGFPRMVRDVANTLGKNVRFDIVGEATQVDRDILERLDAPLGHLLRNAVDHGIETPEIRRAANKCEEGLVRIDAHHSAGALQIVISDDGAGIDIEAIRARVAARKLVDEQNAERLSESELLEFLFLPGFTMKEEVSDISGRGVGLDVVRDMIKQVGGTVTITSRKNEGTRFQLQLPLTLSVIRTLLVEIAGEPYGFSFAQILRAVKAEANQIATVEGRQFIDIDGDSVGLVTARQVLGLPSDTPTDEASAIVVIGGQQGTYGVVVDRFLGARELVVQPLDRRLGKIKDISAGALMDDGTPLLIFDADDMVQSIVKIVASDHLSIVREAGIETSASLRRKRVLVVDDSFTVRELQRKLFDHHGYDVELAVDGMEGWNSIRKGTFDLVVSDVDMPRMDGIELVRLIKQDPRLKDTPVMILSYKDREDDRLRGLDAGADYYLTKGSYQSDALIEAVFDLIGPSHA